MKYLIVGLENSASKAVSKIIAKNLNIKGAQNYNGHKSVSDEDNFVQHYSLPYGQCRPKNDRAYYPEIKESEWDYIIITTRDYNCSLLSKIEAHQPSKELAIIEHSKGKEILCGLIKYKNCEVFSYESWNIMEEGYLNYFLNKINIECKITQSVKEINKKHIKI